MSQSVRLHAGDTVRTRKPHPCGGDEWVILQTGVDVRLRCATCGRVLLLPRTQLLRAVKSIERPQIDQPENEPGG
ncbi:MAG: DUF951 domain-containing protein [Armatimonadetes bacterium]|nr:DUF951 domain-containing protein [Armatimonadota bacterium]